MTDSNLSPDPGQHRPLQKRSRMEGGQQPVRLERAVKGVLIVALSKDSSHFHHHPAPQDGLAEWRLRECASLEVQVRPVDGPCHVWLGDERQEARPLPGGLALCTVAPGNFVGASRLRVDLGGRTLLDEPLEVYSRKVGYRSHYREILDDLTERVAGLAFTGVSPTSAPASPERGEGTPILTYLVLQYLMHPRRLPAALHRIARHPDRRLL